MTEQKHPPIPWTADYDNRGNGGFAEWYNLLSADGGVVGRIHIHSRSTEAVAEAAKDLVLRAVNAHEELVAKLRGVIQCLVCLEKGERSNGHNDWADDYAALIDWAQPALAKAEGGTDADAS